MQGDASMYLRDRIAHMSQNSQIPPAIMQEVGDIRRGKLDIALLRYMARRLHLAVDQFDQSDSLRRTRAQVYNMQERGGRTHRIVVYRAEKLRIPKPLTFVGFISERQKQLSPTIIQAIQRADKKLIGELAGTPSVLSYSSLELRNGDWCNLVLLSDTNAKTPIRNSETHKYAAYHLAPSYYTWIRLHNGVMPEGLDHMEMCLQKSKYYIFYPGQQRSSIQETILRHILSHSARD
jgi:hypothetical protein